MDTEVCRYCGSDDLYVIPGPHPGNHFAKLQCRACNRMVRWLPRPQANVAGPSPEVFAISDTRWREGSFLAKLTGSEGQIKLAESFRRRALRYFELSGRIDLYRVMAAVSDSTWWIANHGRSIRDIHWPGVGQLDQGVSTEGFRDGGS